MKEMNGAVGFRQILALGKSEGNIQPWSVGFRIQNSPVCSKGEGRQLQQEAILKKEDNMKDMEKEHIIGNWS